MPPLVGPALRTDITMVLTVGSRTAEVDGEPLTFDAAPFVTPNGRTMVPVRFVSETLGAQVDWDPETRQVTVRGDWTEIVLTVGSEVALVNGYEVVFDAPVILIGAPEWRTYIPFRFICEKLGAQVVWDAPTRTVTISR